MAVAEKITSGFTSDDHKPWHHYKLGIILNITGMIILILIVIAIFVLVYVTKYHHETESIGKYGPERQSVMRMVTRDQWIAQPPDNPLRNLKLPVDRVIIAATQTEGCSNQAQCIYRVRMIQMYHIETRHFDDIAYNFLVGGDGSVYEGRGWNKQGAHTKGYNAASIGIALIGQFKKHIPRERQFDELKLLLLEGVRLGKISKDYKLYGQNVFMSTDSPGIKVVNEIKNWPHYLGED